MFYTNTRPPKLGSPVAGGKPTVKDLNENRKTICRAMSPNLIGYLCNYQTDAAYCQDRV